MQTSMVHRRVVALGCAAVAVLTGCTGPETRPDADPRLAPQTREVPRDADAVAAELEDPLVEISDRTSADFVADPGTPALHQSGTGPQRFVIDRPDDAHSIRFYVSCAPESTFTVNVGTFYSGPCAGQFQNTGEIPLPAGSVADGLSIWLEIPAGVRFWILGLPVT